MIRLALPAYNEEPNITALLRDICLTFEEVLPHRSYEIVVVDDGSTDATVERVSDFRQELEGDRFPNASVRLFRHEGNRGLAEAIRTGLMACADESLDRDIILTMDADNSHLPGLIPSMIRKVHEGHDVVIASRALPGSELVVRQPWWREMSGRAFNQLVRPISGLPFHDTQCGFKLFRAEAAERLFAGQASSGWAFDVELLMLAQALGYRVLEHPVRWINSEASKVNMLRDAPRMLGDIMAFRWRLWRGRTGA